MLEVVSLGVTHRVTAGFCELAIVRGSVPRRLDGGNPQRSQLLFATTSGVYSVGGFFWQQLENAWKEKDELCQREEGTQAFWINVSARTKISCCGGRTVHGFLIHLAQQRLQRSAAGHIKRNAAVEGRCHGLPGKSMCN